MIRLLGETNRNCVYMNILFLRSLIDPQGVYICIVLFERSRYLHIPLMCPPRILFSFLLRRASIASRSLPFNRVTISIELHVRSPTSLSLGKSEQCQSRSRKIIISLADYQMILSKG